MMAQKTTTYIVNASSLNVRQSPSTDAKIIGKVSKGQLVQVLNIKSGWAYIFYGKLTGYVSAQYLVKKGATSSTQTTSTTTNKTTAQKTTSSSAKASSSSSSKSTTSSSDKVSTTYRRNNSDNWQPYSDGRGAHYAGWIETGTVFRKGMGGAEISTVHGCQIRDYIFTGAGVGLHAGFGSGVAILALPIYADACAYLRVNENVAPYVDLGIGGYLGWAVSLSGYGSFSSGGGFYMHTLAGVQFAKHYALSIGYERMGVNCGTVRFAYCW